MLQQPTLSFSSVHFTSHRLSRICRRVILYISPISGFRRARSRVIDLFEQSYSEIDDVESSFSGESNPDLRQWALEPHTRIPEYDPHQHVKKLFTIPSKVFTWTLFISKLLAYLGIIFAVDQIYEFGTFTFEQLIHVRNVVPGIIFFICTLYLVFLRIDTMVHQEIARELRAGPGMVQTRNPSKIVACGIWNRSLIGVSGVLLVLIFFLLESVSEIPLLRRWVEDPAGYVVSLISENLSLFYQAESTWEAASRVFGRVK